MRKRNRSRAAAVGFSTTATIRRQCLSWPLRYGRADYRASIPSKASTTSQASCSGSGATATPIVSRTREQRIAKSDAQFTGERATSDCSYLDAGDDGSRAVRAPAFARSGRMLVACIRRRLARLRQHHYADTPVEIYTRSANTPRV